jgi:hypothetical protein
MDFCGWQWNKWYQQEPGNSAYYSPHLTALGKKLYAIWYEFNGTANQIRVAVKQ